MKMIETLRDIQQQTQNCLEVDVFPVVLWPKLEIPQFHEFSYQQQALSSGACCKCLQLMIVIGYLQ